MNSRRYLTKSCMRARLSCPFQAVSDLPVDPFIGTDDVDLQSGTRSTRTRSYVRLSQELPIESLLICHFVSGSIVPGSALPLTIRSPGRDTTYISTQIQFVSSCVKSAILLKVVPARLRSSVSPLNLHLHKLRLITGSIYEG